MATPKVFRNTGSTSYQPAVQNDGKQVTIVRELGDDERDIEVGRMFLVRVIESGEEFHVFEDEIFEVGS